MKDIKLTIIINRPAREVFDFTINPENTPKWVEGVVTEQTNETPTKLGTIFKNQDTEGNWREFEINAFEPNIMFEMTEKDSDVHVRYTFTPLGDDKCQLEYYVRTDKEALPGPFNQENIQRILKKLKKTVE